MMIRQMTALAALLATAACHPDGANGKSEGFVHPVAGQHAAQPEPTTVDLQGGYDEWRASPFIHQFYDLTRASFAEGAEKVDFAAYQDKSYAIFRAYGGASGGGKAGEEAMLDHLKDIPRQMVGIVKEDPSVLESYDKFWVALSGPP